MNSKNAHGDGKNIYSLFYILSSLFFKSVPVNGLACSIVTGRVREPTYWYRLRAPLSGGTAALHQGLETQDGVTLLSQPVQQLLAVMVSSATISVK